jgi:hypothetical protein
VLYPLSYEGRGLDLVNYLIKRLNSASRSSLERRQNRLSATSGANVRLQRRVTRRWKTRPPLPVPVLGSLSVVFRPWSRENCWIGARFTNVGWDPAVMSRCNQRVSGAQDAKWAEEGGIAAAFETDQPFIATEDDRLHLFLHRQTEQRFLNRPLQLAT